MNYGLYKGRWIIRPKEEAMKITKPDGRSRVKLVRKVLWSNGAYGVVSGPFPAKFVRSETRKSVKAASEQFTFNLVARAETTQDDQYALVFLSDILDSAEENEFGPVCP